MYKCLNDEGYASFEEGQVYAATTKNRRGNMTVENLSEAFPSDWQLVEPEQKPFVPTHEVTGGTFKNAQVVLLERLPHGKEFFVKDEEGVTFYVHENHLSPLQNTPTKTHLSESQYNDLIKRIADEINFAVVWEVKPTEYKERAETAVREWAESNQIELP